MDELIVQAVDEFQDSLDQAIDQFSSDVKELEDEGLTTEEILIALGIVSITDYFLQDLKMQAAIGRFMSSMDLLLDETIMFAGISESKLRALRNMFQSSITTYIGSLGDTIRSSLASGVSRGLDLKSIRKLVKRNISLLPSATERMISTTMATFSRAVTSAMLEENPNQRLIYIGPLDEKTRPICIEMLSSGTMTATQIESAYPGALTDGGGINCRHKWGKGVIDKGKSKRASGMKKDFKRKPITLQEYYEIRG
jgi:hypothetical protein